MLKTKNTASILQHIEFYCSEIKATIQRYGDDIDTFLNDRDYQRSVCFSLAQLGENAKGLSSEFRLRENDIQWKRICGLRDIVVHSYGTVDFNEIFDIIHQNVDDLLNFCSNWLSHNPLLDSSKETPPAQTQSQEQNEKK